MVGAICDCKTGENIPHRIACRAPGVSEAWFYKWRRRPAEPTKREIRRTALAEWIRCFFDRSGKTYGSPRITLDLWEEGWQVSQNTVGRARPAGPQAAAPASFADPPRQAEDRP